MFGLSRAIAGIPSPLKVTGIAFSGDTDDIWDDGDIVTIDLTFEGNVTVTGTPKIVLGLDSGDVDVTYASGTGTNTIRFTYTVQSSDNSPQGTIELPTAIDLNGGTMVDADSNQVGLGLSGVSSTISAYTVAATPNVQDVYWNASVSRMWSHFSWWYLLTGDYINVYVVYNKPITVTGSPYITLQLPSGNVNVPYYSGTGTTTLQFRYQLQAADKTFSATEGASLNEPAQFAQSITLNSGTLKDANTLNAPTSIGQVLHQNGGYGQGFRFDVNCPLIGDSAGGGTYAGRHINTFSTSHFIVGPSLGAVSDTWTNANSYATGLTSGSKSDWILPTRSENGDLYINRAAIGGFTTGVSYWTRDSCGAGSHYATQFTTPTVNSCRADGHSYYYRAIRYQT